MIEVGSEAPDFSLRDQFGRTISLSQFRGAKHVLLAFYPLDFTPTWSIELPALEARLEKFEAAHTQVMSVSVDSSPVHANFGSSLGGISYPMLADFHPKGAVAESLGVYQADRGTADRATVIVDAAGIVRHCSSIGQRDMDVLAATCAEIDSAYEGELPSVAAPPGLPAGSTVYIRNNCGASRAVLLARTNLHLDDLVVKNVSENDAFMNELESLTSSKTAPVLLVDGKVMAESMKIVSYLAETCSRL